MTKQLVPALFLLFLGKMTAQSYQTAVGLRLDGGLGFAVNQHLKNRFTAEAMAWPGIGGHPSGVSFVAKDHHKIITRATNWYWGAGGHFYSSSLHPGVAVGPSGILGFEATLGKLNFSIDEKVDLQAYGPSQGLWDFRTGLSLRYVLKKRERPKLVDRLNLPKWKKKQDSKPNKKKRSS